jgi:hypothetical protein
LFLSSLCSLFFLSFFFFFFVFSSSPCLPKQELFTAL